MGPGASYGIPYATYPWETTPTRHAPARGAPAAGPPPASCTCARHSAFLGRRGQRTGAVYAHAPAAACRSGLHRPQASRLFPLHTDAAFSARAPWCGAPMTDISDTARKEFGVGATFKQVAGDLRASSSGQ